MKIKRILRESILLILIMCLVTGCGVFASVPPVESGGEGASEPQFSGDAESESEPEIKPEDLGPVKEETKVAINDMSKAFHILLERGTKKFYEGYPVDETFLHWVNNRFGEETILDLAYRLYEGYDNTALWYSKTGNTMHVLWLMYCREMKFATYYLDGVQWLECADKDVVTIDFTGDINLADDRHTMQAAATKANGIYDCIDTKITQEMQAADLSVINNEFVFSDRGTALEGKAYTFRAKTANIALLEVFGTDVANLANNHVYDFGEEGLLDSVATLRNAGIQTMGAGKNLREASAILYYVANGKKIAFVSATQIERYSFYTKEATATTAGVLKTKKPEIYNEVIREAAANSDYVIASVHWGTEGTYRYAHDQYDLAMGFVEAGADVIIGGHPHRIQGVEYIKNVPVLFSLGNFWFSTGTLYTMIAQVQIDAKGELSVRAVPCIQRELVTSMIEGEEAEKFYKFLADVSTNIVIDANGYIYNTADGRNEALKDGSNYQSGMRYGSYNGKVDLDGREIDIVGNLR